MTLTEVLVHPMRHGDHELANQYRRILLHAAEFISLRRADLTLLSLEKQFQGGGRRW